MIHKKIHEALKMFESGDVNEVTIDVNDVIINITRKGYTSQVDSNKSEWILHSPFVGVVYMSNTNGDFYIEKNQKIDAHQTLCFIESLKIHHEIVSDHSGMIEEIYVKNKEFVEYNQPLFKIKRL